MRWTFALVLLPLAALGGCAQREWMTRARIQFEEPLQVDLTTELDSVRPLPLDHGDRHGPQVALLDIDGLLLTRPPEHALSTGESAVSLFRERLEAVAGNSRVRAVVLRINSPGGSVTASDVMARDLRQFKQRTGLPVVACLMDVGTGGALYVASQADLVIAHPTTITGGLGVMLNLYNLSLVMENVAVLDQSVKSGPMIDMATDTRMLEPEEEQILQQMADAFQMRLEQAIRQARPDLATDSDAFDGRVYHGAAAAEIGLVDETGYLDDAVAAAEALAGVQGGSVVLYRRDCDLPGSAYEGSRDLELSTEFLPLRVPGVTGSQLPLFLYMWAPQRHLH